MKSILVSNAVSSALNHLIQHSNTENKSIFMSGAFGIHDAEKKIAEFELAKFVKDQVTSSGRSMRELSGIISGNENYISQQIKHKNINIPLLYTLTTWLNVNMFEPFLLMLPEHKRGTKKNRIWGKKLLAYTKNWKT